MARADDVVALIREQAHTEQLRVSQHAQQEMAEEAVTLDDLLHVLATCQLLEDYPEHLRARVVWC